jgi:hypothetical protein
MPAGIRSAPQSYLAPEQRCKMPRSRSCVRARIRAVVPRYESNGFSTYNSLQLTLNKRFSHGYSILANYTWARSIDNISLDTAGAVQNTFDMRSEKALSDFDVRKRFVTSFLWEIPSPKKGLARWIMGGWQMNGIFTISSGSPFNLVSGQDRALTGGGSQRPAAQRCDHQVFQSSGICVAAGGLVRQQRPEHADRTGELQSGLVSLQNDPDPRVHEAAVPGGVLQGA